MDTFNDFLYFKLGTAWKKVQKYYNKKSIKKYGISITQAYLLFCLLDSDGMNIKTLAEKLSIDSSAVTGLIDRMEKEKLVMRRVAQADRRSFTIHLTDKGRDCGLKLLSWYQSLNVSLTSSLKPKQLSALDSLLKETERLD